MADHAHSPHPAPDHAVNMAMAACLVVAVGGLVAAYMNAPKIPEVTEASFMIESPTIDAARLAAERKEHYPEVDLTQYSAEIAELEKVVREANAAQFAPPDAMAAHDMQIVTLHEANAFITKAGIEAFVPAGAKMFDACEKAFGELLTAVQTGKLTAAEAEEDPGDAHVAYRENCGNAFGPLLMSGVINEKGQWTNPQSGPLVFGIMNRFRWAAVLDMRAPPWKQLSPYEYEILTRWRLSMNAVPVAKRIEWVVSAGQVIPNFPKHELLGSLLLEGGDAVGALGAYEEACSARKTDLLLQRKCKFLRTRVPALQADAQKH